MRVIGLSIMGFALWAGSLENSSTSNEQDSFLTNIVIDSNMDVDPYEDIEDTIPETGEVFEQSLATGQYIVGIHIPEGHYEVQIVGEESVHVRNSEIGLYMHEYPSEENNHLEDMWLFNGSTVTVESETQARVITQNAQPLIGGEANPVTEGFSIQPGEELVAGDDFTPGIYDITYTGGEGVLYIKLQSDVWNTDEDENTRHYYVGGCYGEGFHYLVIPWGATVSSEKIKLQLEPTGMIESTDYTEFYQD